MAHLTGRTGYKELIDRYNKFPQGAPESETLHNLIFDNQAMKSHKFMAAFTGAFLKLPPVKQVLVSEKFQSKYLMKLIDKVNV